MSGNVLGGIEIQMLADLARLRQDMDGAKGIVGKATDEMGKMAAGLKTAGNIFFLLFTDKHGEPHLTRKRREPGTSTMNCL